MSLVEGFFSENERTTSLSWPKHSGCSRERVVCTKELKQQCGQGYVSLLRYSKTRSSGTTNQTRPCVHPLCEATYSASRVVVEVAVKCIRYEK